MNDKDLQFLEKNWRTVPFPVLAQKFSLTPIQLSSFLRQKGIATEIQPFELEYIKENINRMPSSQIQAELSLTDTQFAQIVQKVLKTKRRKPVAKMMLPEALSKTKWLIEEKLYLDVDDLLPRKITNKHFYENDLYSCIKFAGNAKQGDFLYQHFTAVAFLVCHTYPHAFRPFQFRHAKKNMYFKGRGGRKNLINAARWIIERKMGHKPENLSIISTSKYFLRSSDLQFYGVGSHWFRLHFGSHDEFIAAILNEYRITSRTLGGSTHSLRQALYLVGRAPDNCEVPGCYFDDEYGLEIHHIVPRSAATNVKFNVNFPENLIALCPNHHKLASKFDWKALDLGAPDIWVQSILNFIEEEDRRSEPAVPLGRLSHGASFTILTIIELFSFLNFCP